VSTVARKPGVERFETNSCPSSGEEGWVNALFGRKDNGIGNRLSLSVTMLSVSNFVCSILPFRFTIVSSESSASSGVFLFIYFFEYPVDVDDDDDRDDDEGHSYRFFF